VRKSRYGVFRDYSGSFVCDEFGQRGRSKILHDSPVLLDALKKNREKRVCETKVNQTRETENTILDPAIAVLVIQAERSASRFAIRCLICAYSIVFVIFYLMYLPTRCLVVPGDGT